MEITITANSVAWYAAIVATISMAVTSYSIWRDRAQLFVRIAKDMVMVGLDLEGSAETYLQVTIANRGRRPVLIGTIAVKEQSSEQLYLLADSIKRPVVEIPEGKSHSEMIEQAGLNLEKLRLVLAIDGTGREWVGRLHLSGESRLHCNKVVKWWLRIGICTENR